jgi:hypothetical protein
MSASIPQISNMHAFAVKDAAKDLQTSNLKTIAFKSLLVISAVAITAILATIIGLAIAGVVLTGPLPFILMGVSFSTVLLALGGAKSLEAAMHSNKVATFNKKLVNNLNNIKDWNDTHIKEFFAKHNLKADPNKPADLKNLKNLIARFTYLETKFDKHQTKGLGTFNAAAPAKSGNWAFDCETRHEAITIGWNRLEMKALPYKLEAAHCLELIKNPFNQSLKPVERRALQMKTYALRYFDRKQHKHDGYLNLGDRSLTFQQVRDLSIDEIRAKVYDK